MFLTILIVLLILGVVLANRQMDAQINSIIYIILLVAVLLYLFGGYQYHSGGYLY